MPDIKKTIVKKKYWYIITANDALKNAVLGESFLSDPAQLKGKHITVNLVQVTNDSKNQSVNLKFLINAVENNRGIADPIGYEIMPSSIRRLIRKEKKKLSLSFICETADKVKIIIKPLTIIKKTTKGSIEKALRKQTQEFLTKSIQKMRYNDLILNMINYKLQESLKNHLKKIYPLKVYEIRQMERVYTTT